MKRVLPSATIVLALAVQTMPIRLVDNLNAEGAEVPAEGRKITSASPAITSASSALKLLSTNRISTVQTGIAQQPAPQSAARGGGQGRGGTPPPIQAKPEELAKI